MKANITFKRVFGVFLGVILLGLGVAFFNQAGLGQDSLAALCFSLNYLINESWSYGIFYFGVNFIFFILMLIFLREHIFIGTIVSLVLTGLISSQFMYLFNYIGFIPQNLIIRILVGFLGIVNIALGIAFYGGAKLGISPYDSLPLIICKYFPKFKYKFVRIAMDLTCLSIAIIIGLIILNRKDVVGVFTILSLILSGPLISLFSKLFNKIYYKDTEATFS